MSNPKFNLPEPVFPEHALIRDSAPVPQLSAGFKSRVMSECRVSTAKAVQVRRWKYAGGAAAVCCLGVLFCLLLPNGSQSEPVPVAEQHSPVSPSSGSPSSSMGLPSQSNRIAVDMPKPTTTRDPEKSQMNQIIDTLKNRSEIIPADMLKF
ncbi:MAG: hypothetical protein WAO83_06580 [Fuerstiella sp.]